MKKIIILIGFTINLTACDEKALNLFLSEFETQFNSQFTLPELEKCIKQKRAEYISALDKAREYTKAFNKTKSFAKKSEYSVLEGKQYAEAYGSCLHTVECMQYAADIEGADSIYHNGAKLEKQTCDIYLNLAEQMGVRAGLMDRHI